MAEPLEARRKHAGIVENKRIARLQNLRQIADCPVLKRLARIRVDA